MENGDLCPICENNIVLVHICNDCNVVFCSDCLRENITEELVCSQCGSNEITNSKDSDFVCAKCKSENIVSRQKHEYFCPSCSSKDIMKVSEKKELIKTRFNEIINNTHSYIDPLEEKIMKITGLQNNLIDLREDTISVLHFNNLEMELIQIIKLFDNTKKAVQKKTAEYYDEINRNLEYFFGLDSLSAKMLPVVIAIAEDLEGTSLENIEFIKQSLSRLDSRIKPIDLKIDFMNKIQSLFKSYSGLIALQEDDVPMFGLKCKLDSVEEGNNEYSSKNGVILLTAKRLYFLHEKGFLFKKKTTLLFSLLLSDLNDIREEGSIHKKLSLDFASGMYKFKLNKEKRGQLKDFINKAATFDASKFNIENTIALKAIQCTIEKFKYSLEDAIFTLIGYQSKKIRDAVMNRYKTKNISNQTNKYPEELSSNSTYRNEPKNRINTSCLRTNCDHVSKENENFEDFPYLNKCFGKPAINNNNTYNHNKFNEPDTNYDHRNQHNDELGRVQSRPQQYQESRDLSRQEQYQDGGLRSRAQPRSSALSRARIQSRPSAQHRARVQSRPSAQPGRSYIARKPRNHYVDDEIEYCEYEIEKNLDYLYDMYNRRPMPMTEYREERYYYMNEPDRYYEPRIENRYVRRENYQNQYGNSINNNIRNLGNNVFNQNFKNTPDYENYNSTPMKTNNNYTNDYSDSNTINSSNYTNDFIDNENNNINNRDNNNDSQQSHLFNTLKQAKFGSSINKNKISNDFNLKQLENTNHEIFNSLKMEKSVKNNAMGRELRKNSTHNINGQSTNRNNGQNRNPQGLSIIRGIKSIFNEKEDYQYTINKLNITNNTNNRNNINTEAKIDTSQLYREDRKKERLLGLQKEEHSIQKTIEMISMKLKRGLISEENYIEHYQKYQSLLFNIQKQIRQLSR